MVRKNSSRASHAAPVVADQVLADARLAATTAAAQLQDAEHSDLGADAYAAALRASRVAARRVETLEQQRAEQLERAGQREAAVKAAARDLKATGTALTASRDQVAAAAAEHLRSLAALTMAIERHNGLLADARARLAGLGLRVDDEGQEHPEGIHDGPGVRLAGIDWTPVPAGGIVAHALRQTFADAGPAHPLREFGKFVWRPHEVQARPDQLAVPTLADVAAVAPEGPRRVAPDRPSAKTMAAPVQGDAGPVRIGA